MAAQRAPLKVLLFNRENVSRLASELAAVGTDFAADRFVDDVCDRLPAAPGHRLHMVLAGISRGSRGFELEFVAPISRMDGRRVRYAPAV